jgi:DNA ligase 1
MMSGRGLEVRATELRDLADAFDRLAATGVIEQKRAMLLELFSRCQTGREAAYLCKIIFGDLRTGVQEGVLQAAIAVAFDKPLAKIQRCHLLVGDLDEVAVLARNDALEAAQFRLFHPIQFMLATPQDTAEIAAQTMSGRAFFAEDKLDGIRAQVHKSGDRIAIYTRTMDRTDESFPEVVRRIKAISGDFLLDGEIVPFRDGRVLPFAHLQRRLGRKKLTPRVLADNPVAFIAFDLLYLDGRLLMECPLRQRREQLNKLAASGGLLTTSVTEVSTASQISENFAAARDRRNEGIVLKDPDSCYSPGRRGKAWLKLKTHLPTFDCVVTAAEYGNGKRRNVLSDYTFAVWSTHPHDPEARLLNIGKAYSGVTDEEIAQLTELFLSIARQQIGRVFLVEPKIVLEIAADQIQKSDRHASGYALRFPRIKRIRWDKTPDQADRIERIIEVYESAHNFGRQEQEVPQPEPTLFD